MASHDLVSQCGILKMLDIVDDAVEVPAIDDVVGKVFLEPTCDLLSNNDVSAVFRYTGVAEKVNSFALKSEKCLE